MILDFFIRWLKRRDTPTEIIERGQHPELEKRYIKVLGKGLYNVSGDRKYGSVGLDDDKLKKYIRKNPERELTELHTHPTKPGDMYWALPSIPGDLKDFFKEKKYRTSIIAQTDASTGKVLGYTILQKKKSFPQSPYSRFEGDSYSSKGEEFWKKDILDKCSSSIKYTPPSDLVVTNFKNIAKQLNLAYKFVPVKGYELDEASFNFVPKQQSLEQKVSGTTAIISILLSLFFFQTNLTGNAIANLSNSASNSLGIILFLIGIVSALFYFKEKKR